MTWLGILNFVVLQWFGVRLARVVPIVLNFGEHNDGRIGTAVDRSHWRLLRWIWPLTGWWSDYRWIARRS